MGYWEMFYLGPLMYHHQWEVVLSGALELVREIGIPCY